ncbi:chemotaxis protein CheW [Methylobacterium planeticum]|uniref:Chemotaxis protein CheW n=1 Tax=Methylobacterium planeticum TaxID=2615211 RepID=A0A6N6MK67_9HYPH|nr:chemotaxis protein CheW [Methylobacterium planeticum]KAB1071542.1 chemotaxis protein CheW [Methylobacterium planeticum]
MERAADAGEAERARTLRAARTAALARRGSERAGGAGVEAAPGILVCTGGGERYGLPMAAVARVLPARPCTPIPGAPPALLGIVALSGGIVSVIGLARALGRGPARDPARDPGGERAEEGHLVVLRGGAAPLALAVDRVLGVARLDGGSADPAARDTASDAARDAARDTARDAAASALGAFGGLGSEAVSGYGPAERGAAGLGDFVVIDLPRLLRRYLP